MPQGMRQLQCSKVKSAIVAAQVEFLRPMTAGILSERRAVAPFGLSGGQPGQKGQNLLIRADGRVVNLGGKATVQLQAGDCMRICTPGAGGYGPRDQAANDIESSHTKPEPVALQVGSVHEYKRLQESA